MEGLEIRPHKWDNCKADFFPFVDGEPRHDLANCCHCVHFINYETNCRKVQEVGDEGDDKIYPFCGPICGYFTPKE
ncbi:hypothetical protein G3578_07570 [Brevibacillus sp. SYP-B805]|uniref:hypothetical protein n=1 Tax=Brevibacillus sp. SYP-B805 TaxID=1578199 RepID=UPI0013ECE9E4|nr:hypothetical protein [Brevibacillus sp. SYP-B805]NGQ95043.1 hypothetical protein [Brevibacillus sp. SYP-B805]